jgi:DNA-binding MarR family transcriptional regulator/ribosomal protein S18 acetylase RimI-like enzyme
LTRRICLTKVRQMDPAAVQRVRTFNRTVAERIGALSDQFLGRGRPMGESRALWEIGPDGIEVRELRDRLGLDSGYASRVLGALQREGLITVKASSHDGRARFVRPTAKGRAERAELDRRADRVALSFLEPLDADKRAKLVTAMTEVDRLLRASLVKLAVEDPRTADARWCIEQYFLELDARFEGGFDPSQTLSVGADELVPPAGVLIIARLHGEPIGGGALKFHGSAPADLKRMWVAPQARGLGLGRRLLEELEQHARDAGAKAVRLETNRSLKEAIQLYRTSGYREVAAFNAEPYGHHWFEKDLSPR